MNVLPPSAAQVNQLASLVTESARILFITGAGISADSGLPTYRGIGGLYNDGGTEEGVPIEVALSGPMMERDPGLCWKYIHQIEAACRGARHNAAHEIIAELEGSKPHVCVLTQNVDGFHRQAGSTNVIDIHGDVHDLLCTSCAYRSRVADYADLEIPPSCPKCGGLIRPGVVLFGEMLPVPAVQHLRRELANGFDLVVSIGTTSVFPYIAQPVLEARQRGVPAVEINPGLSEVSELVDLKISAGARATLEAVREVMQS